MKRIVIALAVLLALFVCVLILLRPDGYDPYAPRYLVFRSQPPGPFGIEMFSSIDPVPVRDGKTWITTYINATNYHSYLYDLDRRVFLGELSNAGPVLANRDQTRILCEGFASPVTTLKGRIAAMLNRISPGKTPVVKTNRIETFWMLDLPNNRAKRLGELSQWPGTSSRWRPAPGFRFGCNVPNNEEEGRSFYLCDMDNSKFEKIGLTGDVRGWWDDHDLVFKDSNSNYCLFDVIGRKSSPLFTTADVTQFLAQSGVTNYPQKHATIFNWDGSNYDFYLTGDRRSGLDTNTTFLLRIEHDGPRFTLLSRNFQLHWLGYFDATGTHYLYSGESGAPGNGGNGSVYLRDLSNNADHVLVPPNNSGGYALARLWNNSVIYSRNRQLWRMDINTTNTSRLLPAPAN